MSWAVQAFRQLLPMILCRSARAMRMRAVRWSAIASVSGASE